MTSRNSVKMAHKTTAAAGPANSPRLLHRGAALANLATDVAPKYRPALSAEEAIGQARLLKALADPTRLRILRLLSQHEGEVCVFDIVESFPLEQPTISHHLRLLRDAGLIDCRKAGPWAYYYVLHDALQRAQDAIEKLA